MPRFHLHLHNAHVEASDEEGHNLVDLAAAQAMVLRGIRDSLGHEVMTGKMDMRGQIDIVDDGGILLLTVRFDEAVEIIKSSWSLLCPWRGAAGRPHRRIMAKGPFGSFPVEVSRPEAGRLNQSIEIDNIEPERLE